MYSELENGVERFPALRLTREGRSSREEVVAREFPVTIVLDNEELVTLLCSPQHLDYLAAGFLSSEGFLKSRDEIRKIVVDDERGVVRLETCGEGKELAHDVLFKRIISSGCGRGASFYSIADVTSHEVESRMEVSTDEVFALVNKFQHGSQLYLATGGVHSAALCDRQRILLFAEDIGRHNAIDKVFGECLLRDMPTPDRIVITSGRISSEILHKVARRGIPILVSISQPTNLGVRIAGNLGVTLVGSVRGRRMNVFTNSWRVTENGG